VISVFAVRIAALLLLLTAACCLFATDPLFPQWCQEDSSNSDSGSADPGCFCCCAHVIPSVPFAPNVGYTFIATVSDPPLLTVSADRPQIYHPPRG